MTNQVIPEAAVEVAAKYFPYAHLPTIRLALEAAAPHILAELRADLVKLAQEFDAAEGGTLAYTVIIDRFGMRKNAHDQLMYIVDEHLRPTPRPKTTTKGERCLTK